MTTETLPSVPYNYEPDSMDSIVDPVPFRKDSHEEEPHIASSSTEEFIPTQDKTDTNEQDAFDTGTQAQPNS